LERLEMLDAYSRRKQYEARLFALELMRGLGQAFGGEIQGEGGSENWVAPDDLLSRMGVSL
jgi:hypothetical protein